MSHFDYGISDIADDDSWVRAMSRNQRGGTAPLRTSHMAEDYAQQGITTYSVSDVLQGSGIYKPTGAVYDRFNQSITSDLGGMIASGGGPDVVLPSGRASLLPYDALRTQLFDDGRLNSELITTGSGFGATTAPPAGTVQAAGGLRFTDGDNLQGNVFAAREHIRKTWPDVLSIGGYAYRRIAGSSRLSDHALGLALDAMVAAGAPASGGARQLGDTIAHWFQANPKAFGTKYIIWFDNANYGDGWVHYNSPANNPTNRHQDHVHISFDDTGQTTTGPMGGGFPE